VNKPVAKTTTTATPAVKPVTPRAPKWKSLKGTEELEANRKYKVDMYPFARY